MTQYISQSNRGWSAFNRYLKWEMRHSRLHRGVFWCSRHRRHSHHVLRSRRRPRRRHPDPGGGGERRGGDGGGVLVAMTAGAAARRADGARGDVATVTDSAARAADVLRVLGRWRRWRRRRRRHTVHGAVVGVRPALVAVPPRPYRPIVVLAVVFAPPPPRHLQLRLVSALVRPPLIAPSLTLNVARGHRRITPPPAAWSPPVVWIADQVPLVGSAASLELVLRVWIVRIGAPSLRPPHRPHAISTLPGVRVIGALGRHTVPSRHVSLLVGQHAPDGHGGDAWCVVGIRAKRVYSLVSILAGRHLKWKKISFFIN